MLYWGIIEKEFDAVFVTDNDRIYCVSVCVCEREREREREKERERACGSW
jgi:hypothetical protein